MSTDAGQAGKSLNCCHQMSYFKAKMHQIRLRLGSRLLRELTAIPRPSWIEGAYF